MFGLLRAKKDLQKYMDLHDSDIKVISQLTTRNHELQAIIEHLQAELDYHKAKLETIKGELSNERHTTSRITSYNVCYTKLLRLFWDLDVILQQFK